MKVYKEKKKKYYRKKQQYSESSEVFDTSNACMKIYRVGWTEWTPVNEQNRAAKQRHTKGVVL